MPSIYGITCLLMDILSHFILIYGCIGTERLIKKKNYRLKHAKRPDGEELPGSVS